MATKAGKKKITQGRYVAQQLNDSVWYPHPVCGSKRLIQVLATLLSIQNPDNAHPGEQHMMMAQVLGSLPPMWGTQPELQAAGFHVD